MRLGHLDRTFLSNLPGTKKSPEANNGGVSGFETEMINSAIARLKAAVKEKDIDTMKQTIDLLNDFSHEDSARLSLKEISKCLARCDYKGAEVQINAL